MRQRNVVLNVHKDAALHTKKTQLRCQLEQKTPEEIYVHNQRA